MDITAIDTSDWVGYFAAATRIGEVEFSDVKSLVSRVRARAGARAGLRRLNIVDHGNSSGLALGNDWITVTSLPTYRPLLEQLAELFNQNGFVHLQHCEAGQNHALLGAFSAIVKVPVYAGTGLHNPVYRFNWGRYERCVISGDCESDVARPD